MRRKFAGRHAGQAPWHRRARQAVHRSLRVRLVLVFVLLALAMAVTFIAGVQKAVAVGWREAARPLLVDYVDHLAREVGSPPNIERAQAITARLPIALRISGPAVNWDSQPGVPRPGWARDPAWRHSEEGENLLVRTTADGHRLEFGLSVQTWQQRPRIAWVTLAALLLLTALAYLYVRRLLRPLDDIRAGAQRFGAGAFDEPIPVRCAHKPDELGQLAATINTMGSDIHQMLDAKRALLLAMSHELRSPLTRARLNAELLPETPAVDPQRQALLRDLGEMARLITDLLESERLAGSHAALHRESVDLAALAREVVAELGNRHAGAAAIALHAPPGLPAFALDRARMRLLLRNLLDNSLRHTEPGCAAARAAPATARRRAGDRSARPRPRRAARAPGATRPGLLPPRQRTPAQHRRRGPGPVLVPHGGAGARWAAGAAQRRAGAGGAGGAAGAGSSSRNGGASLNYSNTVRAMMLRWISEEPS